MSKKDDLLQSAEILFYQEGFHRTGVAKIAEQANTTQRTLYKHFATKEALILAIMEQRELRYWQEIKRLDETHSQGRWSLVPFYALKDWFEKQNHGGCFYLNALSEYQGKDEEIVQYVRDYKQRREDDLVNRLEKDGILQPDLASLLMLIYEGITASSALGISESTWEKIFEHISQLLIIK
ncbi:TetR/AcrR family transcriptional regulator [Vibrio algivorus]|uniref:TetR family transcriptional regulator n=1 Tax=Vibrio algivorus TaxID=1667024 RepID=A0ABQ6EJU4_9VIBR|nr:TetR/AcrR family transcriptional regulator [Vibrio algivorus]GLT13388.1 TetR family transcriptional regulator [Vibrio algivorus]